MDANKIETRCGGLLFTSKFDSGNLTRVEKVSKDDDEDAGGNYFTGGDPKADYEFNVWTSPDVAGTSYENGNRSWFHFGVRGGAPGRLLKLNIMNLNRQGKLYGQGHSPLVKTVPGRPRWERIRDRPTWEETNPSRRRSKNVDSNFVLSFTHRFLETKGGTTYFAFCFPWSYTESQNQFAAFDELYLSKSSKITTKTKKESIYYHRELLCHSLDKLRIDLVTISSCHGITDEEEPRFDDKLFPDKDTPRCKKFKNKRVYLVSSRVHPGETPASFVFNGFIDFILREDDPRAIMLRKQYVFKLIPMLNPDGVYRGHYRTDSRGVNLNRMYLDPSFDIYPSIYASKALLVHHHVNNRVTHDAEAGLQCSDEGASEIGEHGSSGDGKNPTHAAAEGGKAVIKPTSTSQVNPNAAGPRSKTYNVVYDNGTSTTTVVDAKMPADQKDFRAGLAETELFTGKGMTDSEQEQLMNALDRVSLVSEPSNYGAMESSDNDNKYDGVFSSNDLASGGECEDIEDVGPHIGNEGSDDDEESRQPMMTEGVYAPHLSDPKLLEIAPHDSGIAFYVDLHAHASKRGCFIYGNYFDNEETHMENLLFPKLMSMNTAHFDFTGSNFTERNMYLKDKREGLSKAGAGRVAIMKAIGITHSYTLECNYNTGRMVNSVPPANGDNGRATPPPLAGFPPKYTMAHFEDVGRAMAVAALDFYEWNPWSRLTLSEYCSLHGVKEWIRRFIRGQRGLPRGPVNRPQRQGPRGSTGAQAQNPFVPRVALLAQQRQNANNSSQADQSQPSTLPGRPAYPRRPYGQTRQPPGAGARGQGPPPAGAPRDKHGPGAVVRRDLAGNTGGAIPRRGEGAPPGTNRLGPIKDIPRATADRSNRRRLSASSATTSMTNVTMTSSASSIPQHAPQLHHTSSAPVTLSMTTAQSTDLRNLSKPIPPDQPRPFLQPHTPRKPMSTTSTYEQHPGMSTWPGYTGSTPRDGQSSVGFSTHTVNSYGVNYVGIPATPPGSAGGMAEYITGMPASGASAASMAVSNLDTESIQSIEEEKVQQLRNFPNLSGSHRYQKLAKPLEAPNRTDPVKRKSKKPIGGKRRSASYSPKSAKGKKSNTGSGTDSDAEKKTKGRRRKSWANKQRVGSRDEDEDELEDIFESNFNVDGGNLPNREKITPSQDLLRHPPGLPRAYPGRALQHRADPSDIQSQLPPSAPPPGHPNKKGKKKKKWLAEKSSKNKLKSTSEVALEEEANVAREQDPDAQGVRTKTPSFWIDL